MDKIREKLWELRRLRLQEAKHSEKAVEFLNRATHGTGSKRAADIGGTGDCPLTNNADSYTREREASVKAKHAADAIWKQIEPLLIPLELDPKSVITLYYNVGMDWKDIPSAIKRSPYACDKMHKETIEHLEKTKG